jgi:hypothetical protein
MKNGILHVIYNIVTITEGTFFALEFNLKTELTAIAK